MSAGGGAAVVKYEEGMGQAGSLNSGISSGIGYAAPSRRWKVYSLFGYGIQAKRSGGDGGYSLGVAFQYNFGKTKIASDEAYEELEDYYANEGNAAVK